MGEGNKQAFPGSDCSLPGMTLREYAAVKAMQGILASGTMRTYANVKVPAGEMLKDIAQCAVEFADALIEELSK